MQSVEWELVSDFRPAGIAYRVFYDCDFLKSFNGQNYYGKSDLDAFGRAFLAFEDVGTMG